MDKGDIMKFNNIHDTWMYLTQTEVFWCKEMGELSLVGCNCFDLSLNINVVKVNPINNEIDDNELLNTKTQVWLEAGEPYECEHTGEIIYHSHNINYDSGGDTFEEALIEMANLVYKHNEI
jgi:hypothetical protein